MHFQFNSFKLKEGAKQFFKKFETKSTLELKLKIKSSYLKQ